MALAQYAVNTGLAAIYTSYETGQPVWVTWSKHYSCTSLPQLAGAAAAGALVKLINEVGFYTVVVSTPIIAIVYLTHRRYIDDIKASAAQAERAERNRAEAEHKRAEVEHERAEQAEHHVAELNRHIAEQKRISEELERSKEHFRHAAFHDSLTGLPNRALFVEHLKLAIQQVQRQPERSFAVFFLDLDRFKNINDSLGHTCGDQLLIAIARRLEVCLRPGDVVARFGGDEFAILIDGLAHPNGAVRVAEKIQRELLVPVILGQHEAFTTASIGIAFGTTNYEEPEDILRDADTAMYRAKEGGKARCELFDKVMHTRAVALLRLENDLRRAVEREEFRIHYQPIICLRSGKLAGFEALARWQHPERGLVSPAEFIPVAEETGLIVPIGLWMLEEACRQVREWQARVPNGRTLSLSVNLSGKQLAQPDLVEQVKRILLKTGFDSHCLKLEITESVVMENAEAASATFHRLRALGLQLSIDDFGTGYSSLSYLHRFPVNTLKIDRSFVSRMGAEDENLEIVRTILTLARNLSMEVVAEGVESAEQMRHLMTLSCEYGQGYFFSKPMDGKAAKIFIQEDRQYEVNVRGLAGSHQQERDELFGSNLIM